MNAEPENRLIDEPEFRDLLQAAKEIDVDDTWLETQLDQILEKIETPPPSGGSASGTGGSTSSLAQGAFKLFAPIIVGTGIYLALSPATQPQDHSVNKPLVKEVTPALIPAMSDSNRDTRAKEVTVQPPQDKPKVQAPQEGSQSPSLDRQEGQPKSAGKGLGRAEAPPENDDTNMPMVEVVESPSPATLPTKPDTTVRTFLKTIKDARSLASRGDIDQALSSLAPLLETAYRIEALSVQAELAYQHQRYEFAAESMQALLVEKSLDTVTKRSLLRRLGDALAKQGLCGKALLTYQKALRLNPDSKEEAAIRAAMVRCQ